VTATDVKAFELDGFRLELERRQLVSAAGARVEMPARAYDVLLYLIEHRGKDVARDALMKAVWPDTVVEDNNLNQLVSVLRRTFGDTRGEARYIATVPGRGYRFVGAVKEVGSDAQAAGDLAAAISSVSPLRADPPASRPWTGLMLLVIGGFSLLSIVGLFALISMRAKEPASVAGTSSVERASLRLAILPFENLSPDPENAFFTDGVHEQVLSTLAQRAPSLEVISRTTMLSYRDQLATVAQISRALGATHVLEGSVRREGDDVSVTVQLIEGRSDKHVWSQTFERKLIRAMTLQSEIAEEVATSLALELSSESRDEYVSSDPQAYDAYLKARLINQAMTPGTTRIELESAVKLLDGALLQDPKFAAAHLLRARFHLQMFMVSHDNSAARLQSAHEDLDRARALAGDTPSLLATEAMYVTVAEQDFPKALALFDRAGNLSDWFFVDYRASVLLRMGRIDDSVKLLRASVARDPGNYRAHASLMLALFAARRVDEAASVTRFMQERFTAQPAWALMAAQHQFAFNGQLDSWQKAQDIIAGIERAQRSSTELLLNSHLALLRYQGDFAGARASIDELDEELIRLNDFSGHILHAAGKRPKAELRGWTNLLLGDTAAVRSDAKQLTTFIAQTPLTAWNTWHLKLLAAEAALFAGDRPAAITRADEALALMPRARDALKARYVMVVAARIYAWAGASDNAIDLLESLSSMVPGLGPAQISRDPLYLQPLDAEPRFRQIKTKLEAEIAARSGEGDAGRGIAER
jgi:TolB-like protein/DNA-binding winged helix-turn-helix (wHTH) protein